MTDRRSSARFVVGALMTTLLSATAAAQSSPPPDAWIALFNGVDLTGWTPKIRHYPVGENYANTFRVVDGLLTVSYDGYDGDFDGRFGHLFYNEPFSYYRLRLEYRFIGEQAPGGPDWARRNSGAMLHSQPPESMPVEQDFPISIELQLLGGLSDGKPRPTANLCTPGTNVVFNGEFSTAHCFNSSSPTFDGDGWVTVEALVLGGERVEHYVNGQKVIEYASMTTGGGSVSDFLPEMKRDGEPRAEGYISLQSESHPVQFRRVELLNLRGCMDKSSPSYRDWFVASDPASCR